MTPLRRTLLAYGAGAVLLLAAGFAPESLRWALLGAGLAAVAVGLALGASATATGLAPLRGIETRLRGAEERLADLGGTVGRQAPVIRRVDDRTRALLAARTDEELEALDAARPRIVVVRDLDAGRAACGGLAEGERLVCVVPRDVDPQLATRLVGELTRPGVEVLPECDLGLDTRAAEGGS